MARGREDTGHTQKKVLQISRDMGRAELEGSVNEVVIRVIALRKCRNLVSVKAIIHFRVGYLLVLTIPVSA